MSQLTTSAVTFSAPELMGELDRLGATLRADGDQLRFSGPRVGIENLLPEMRRLKPELLKLLESPPSPTGAHRWSEAATAPDVAALSDAIERARHRHWVKPTPELMALWKSLESYHGRPINSQELVAMASAKKQEIKP